MRLGAVLGRMDAAWSRSRRARAVFACVSVVAALVSAHVALGFHIVGHASRSALPDLVVRAASVKVKKNALAVHASIANIGDASASRSLAAVRWRLAGGRGSKELGTESVPALRPRRAYSMTL